MIMRKVRYGSLQPKRGGLFKLYLDYAIILHGAKEMHLFSPPTLGLPTLRSEDNNKQYDYEQNTHKLSFLLGCPKPHPPVLIKVPLQIIIILYTRIIDKNS